MKTKICSKCKAEKSLNNFSPDNRYPGKDKYLAKCKDCKNQYERQKYAKSRIDSGKPYVELNRDKVATKYLEEKICKTCFIELPRGEFYKFKDGSLNPDCKVCAREKVKIKFKEQNSETREKRNKFIRDYYKANPHLVNEISRRKRLREKQATPKFAKISEINNIYKQAHKQGLTVDHIIPLNSKYVTGLHVEHNLTILPRIDNIKKGNRYWPDMPVIDTELKQLAERFYK